MNKVLTEIEKTRKKFSDAMSSEIKGIHKIHNSHDHVEMIDCLDRMKKYSIMVIALSSIYDEVSKRGVDQASLIFDDHVIDYSDDSFTVKEIMFIKKRILQD